MIIDMAGARGRPHPKSTAFPADKSVRAAVVLQPGEPVRRMYEELVVLMGVSGAEVLREALVELHKQKVPGDRLQEAS
ncbi:hypothetical protein [Streptomyces sp. PsTaAH-124]|uniref:hypothetical protein n=1 Tax=Streptomyces sp. PsTaAH-124 TaxID=1157638 RepID=UPI001319FD1D|nr:hypothetical protein [Streptomyces sp. PsTaAH-124]